MAARFLRKQTWWVRFYNPRTGALMRASLETHDEARAELLRERIELEAALLDPRFRAAEVPPGIRKLVRGESAENPRSEPAASAILTEVPVPRPVAKLRARIEAALNQVEEQLRVLKDAPKLQIAVAIMIHAGLRRAETLWLTPGALAEDISYISVVNRLDDEREVESSLKTGDRTVTILPALKTMLEKYLQHHRGKWLAPSSKQSQWEGNGFAKQLRRLNKAAGLRWTCLHYRHTYATRRAAEGWPLFRIAREMGNSVSVVEEYYAGFIRPHSEGFGRLTAREILHFNFSNRSMSAEIFASGVIEGFAFSR
jgi:integrase